MHIAILVTNTDDSAFAARHTSDGEKFGQLILSRRPGWKVSVFNQPKGGFPERVEDFDGFLIGGSPASVHDGADWIARGQSLIRDIAKSERPLFGACFGHQAIATALGGDVGPNPGGWVLGLTESAAHTPAPWMNGDGGMVRMYAAHREQVTVPPPGAVVIGGNDDCRVGAFRIGSRIFTTQYHPEMTHDFISALVDEIAPELPAVVIARARASLATPAESNRVAEWILRFFETA